MALESVSVRLEKDQIRAVETLASRRGVTSAEVFRQVVGAYFQSEADERTREESAIVQRLDRHAQELEQLGNHWRALAGLERELASHQRVLRDDREMLTHFVGALQKEARESLSGLAESARELRSSVERLARASRRHTWKAWAGVLAVAAVTALGTGWLGSWLWAKRHPYAATNRAELEALYYGTKMLEALPHLDAAERKTFEDLLGKR